MTVELRPLGVNCNIACQYCYQNPIRDAGNGGRGYDMGAMKEALAREERPFALFGGEALLVPIGDLEEIFRWGYERFGRNTIQTNGVLVNEAHIALFKRYRVNVGVSVDGPGALNDVRWNGTLERTRAATAKTLEGIEKLLAAGVETSLIITLHRGNASGERLPILQAFVREMADKGVPRVRLHVLEVDNRLVREKYALSTEENVAALMAFARMEPEFPDEFMDVFHDIEQLIVGRDDGASCVWRACDPYTTVAVRGIEGNGQQTNCGRTNKDGIDFVKGAREGYERYIALYHTPQEFNGCKGCRFFLMCKGQCPGTAVDGDWRNRTEYCGLWMELFGYFEEKLLAQGKVPISQHPDRAAIEAEMVGRWVRGQNVTIVQALRMVVWRRQQVGEATV